MTFVKFPKIGQFRDIIKHVKCKTDFKGLDDEGTAIFEHTEAYPTLEFEGTVKLHGTCASVVFNENKKMSVQSRSREITVQNDNAGFAAFIAGLPDDMFNHVPPNFAIFGEWCGGNIQKGVAINGLPKMFVIFAVKDLYNNEWVQPDPDYEYNSEITDHFNAVNVYFIQQFPTFSCSIDFNNPELAQAELTEITEAVEKECPVGNFFDISGIGEGVVWNLKDSVDSEHKFKVKGEKHQTSRVKTLAPVDIEHINNVREFVDLTVTPQRLEQGIQVMLERGLPIERSSTGDYLRWVVADILEEELDQLTGNGLCAKDVGGAISSAARPYWFRKTDEA